MYAWGSCCLMNRRVLILHLEHYDFLTERTKILKIYFFLLDTASWIGALLSWCGALGFENKIVLNQTLCISGGREEKPLIDDDAVMNSVEKKFVAKNDAQVRSKWCPLIVLIYPNSPFFRTFFLRRLRGKDFSPAILGEESFLIFLFSQV